MAAKLILAYVLVIYTAEAASAQGSFFEALFNAANSNDGSQSNIPRTGAELEAFFSRNCYVCHGTTISAVTSSCWETVDESHTRFVEIQNCFGQCSTTVLNHTAIGLVEFSRACESNCTASCYHTDQNTDLCKYCCSGDRCNGILPNYVPKGPEQLDHVSKKNLKTWLRGVLSKPRHHADDPSNKLATRKFIKNLLQNFGLAIEQEGFTISETVQEDQSPFNFRSYIRTVIKGFNIISVVKGKHYGTIRDNMVVLIAHYDTHLSTRGVNDNGSGVAGLLEIARLLSNQECYRNYSVVLVFTDFKEQGSFLDGLAGSGYTNCFVEEFNQLSGSAHFLCGWLLPHMRRTGSRMMASINLHSLLNYDRRPLSQSEARTGRFPIRNNRDRSGDWILASYAQVEGNDHWTSNFSDNLRSMWGTDPTAPGRFIPQEFQDTQRSRVLRDDCFPFLLLRDPLPCITLTDTGPLRGYMRRCHNRDCDDVSHVTPSNVEFLAKTTNAVWRTVEQLSESSCRIPPNAQPSSNVLETSTAATDASDHPRLVGRLSTCGAPLLSRSSRLGGRNAVVVSAACKYTHAALELCRSPTSGVWAALNSGSAWIPKKAKRRQNRHLWIKLNIGRRVNITGIGVQGVPRKGYVSRFMLSYSNDGTNWHWHLPSPDSRRSSSSRVVTTELIGNSNWSRVARTDINPNIIAQYVRLHPRKWRRRIALRLEIFGCEL